MILHALPYLLHDTKLQNYIASASKVKELKGYKKSKGTEECGVTPLP